MVITILLGLGLGLYLLLHGWCRMGQAKTVPPTWDGVPETSTVPRPKAKRTVTYSQKQAATSNVQPKATTSNIQPETATSNIQPEVGKERTLRVVTRLREEPTLRVVTRPSNLFFHIWYSLFLFTDSHTELVALPKLCTLLKFHSQDTQYDATCKPPYCNSRDSYMVFDWDLSFCHMPTKGKLVWLNCSNRLWASFLGTILD